MNWCGSDQCVQEKRIISFGTSTFSLSRKMVNEVVSLCLSPTLGLPILREWEDDRTVQDPRESTSKVFSPRNLRTSVVVLVLASPTPFRRSNSTSHSLSDLLWVLTVSSPSRLCSSIKTLQVWEETRLKYTLISLNLPRESS